MVKESKLIVKKKKKIDFSIVAPKILNESTIGETVCSSGENLIGRTVEINLMNLTMNMRKQNYRMKFMITDIDGTKAKTKAIGFSMNASGIKRIARRGRDKVEDSFTTFSKDKIFVRVKPMLITLHNVSASLRTTLRKSTRYYIKKYLGEHNFNTFIKELTTGTFQQDMQKFLNKLYPLKNSEIRAVKVEKMKQSIKTKEGEVISQLSGMEDKLDKEIKMPERRPRRRSTRSFDSDKPKEVDSKS